MEQASTNEEIDGSTELTKRSGYNSSAREAPSQLFPHGGYSNGSSRRMRRVDSLARDATKLKSMEHNWQENLPLSITLQLAFQTIGVVFGDLGTSPLYVFDSTFTSTSFPNGPTNNDILGALSLIIYTFTLIPLIKYVLIVLKANDQGNGGTFALYSLICRHAQLRVATNQIAEDQELSTYHLDTPSKSKSLKLAQRIKENLRNSRFWQKVLLSTALLGTCAVIGDGVLTPSISVLSAMSGIQVQAPSIKQEVVTGVSCAILIVLFAVQRFGTDKVAFMFSPCVLTWFVCIFIIGLYNIHYHPSVFKAFNPYYIFDYFRRNKKNGWVSLGGVVLAITGTEAMFADLGHFSVKSIQVAFSSLVYPSLMVAYIGQAAYLLEHKEAIGTTFYSSIPDKVFWPMFVVATAAAIIASQAMITATFSIVDQSMVLDCFPRCKVIHTSKKFVGQIYIPEINWILMVLTVLVTAGFKTTPRIGNAYGVAVVSVMLVTTNFLALIIVMVFQRSWWVAFGFWSVFTTFEAVYYSSVLYKVPDGGWVPLAFVGVFFTIMYAWHYGRECRYEYELQHKISMDWVLGLGSSLGMVRVPGIGLVYSELALGVPTIFAHLTRNLPACHSVLVFVCIKHLPVATIPEEERLLVRRVGPRNYRIYRIAVRYGYTEERDEDTHAEFERHLMQGLFQFVKNESVEQPPVPVQIDDETMDHDHQTVEYSKEFRHEGEQQVVQQDEAAEAEEEMGLLEQNRQAGIVYILGRTDVKAEKGSSYFRKFIVDHFYSLLRRNCRSSNLALHIPHSRLIQVGMIHNI